MRGRTRTVVGVVLALSSLVALAACSSSDDDGTARSSTSTSTAEQGENEKGEKGSTMDLTANPWSLVSFTAPAEIQGRDAVLQFAEDGSMSGTTGCNNFAGTYKVDGSDLTITLGPVTRRACTDPALTAQEQAITTGLGEVTTFAVADSTLTLSAGSTVRFTYEAEDTSLVGAWKVTGVNNGTGGLVSSAAVEELVLVFTEDMLTARGGCNTLTANYSTTGEDPLTFGPVSSTKKACEGEAAEADEWLSSALGRTRDVEVVGGVLTMRDAEGAMQVTATRG